MTNSEKANRYDALMAAIYTTKDIYTRRKEDADNRTFIGEATDIIGAYNRGLSDAYKYFIEDLTRWQK